MKKAILKMWLLCLLIMLPGCSQRVSSDHVDKAAAGIVKELEKGVEGGRKVSVTAIGFDLISKGLPDTTPRLLEERLNHHLSRSERFQVVEVDEKATKLIMKFLKDQSGDLYKQSEAVPFGEFKNLHYIVTGSIGLDQEVVQVTAKLTQLKSKLVARSSVTSFPLRAGAGTYLYWIVVAGLVCLVGHRIYRRFNPPPIDPGPFPFKATTCAACRRQIKNRYQEGGKCTTPTCENVICSDCWEIKRKRQCNECKVKTSEVDKRDFRKER